MFAYMRNFMKATILILHLMLYEVTVYMLELHRDMFRESELT